MFGAADLRKMVAAAGVQLKAMILCRLRMSSRCSIRHSCRPSQRSPKRRALVQPTTPQANAHDIGIVGERHVFVVGKEAVLASLALAVVNGDRAAPRLGLAVRD